MWYTHRSLDHRRKTPLYRQLYDLIFEAIESGELAKDDALPPIRTCAEIFGVNRATVVKAYDQLAADDRVRKIRGSGVYVKGMAVEEVEEETSLPALRPGALDLASGTPRSDLFPVEAFRRALDEVIDREGGRAFGYLETRGYLPLRRSIATMLEDVGIYGLPEHLIVISGAQQGIDLVAKGLLNPGDHMVVEAPTYTGAIATFRTRGVRLTEVPVRSGGIDLDRLEEILNNDPIKMLYLMPNFQNPTGATMTPAAKRRLIDLADRFNFYLLEDDYASDLNYSAEEVLPLKSYDTKGRVLYVKSFSKIYLPGLRLGILLAPPKHVNKLVHAKHNTDISTSALIQKAFGRYLEAGGWQEQLERIRAAMARRFAMAARVLEENLPPPYRMTVPVGGLHFWIEAPHRQELGDLYERLREAEIAIVPGRTFYAFEAKDSSFRISIAAVPEIRLERGLLRLCQILKAH